MLQYKKAIILLGAGLFLIGVFFGGFYFYKRQSHDAVPVNTGVSDKNADHSRVIREYEEAQSLLNAGKFHEASLKFEEVLKSPKSLNVASGGFGISQGWARIKLSSSYFYSGEKEKAVKILHAIIGTPSFSDEVRSQAFINLGNYFYEDFDQSFAQSVIFSDKSTELLLNPNNIERSVSNLYNEATKINPYNSTGYYGRGIYYANKLLSRGDIPGSERDMYIGYVLNDLKKGNAAFEEEVDSVTGDVSIKYLLRAKLLFAIQYANSSLPMRQEDTQKIREDFLTSIKMAEDYGKLGLRARYQYMSWMLMNKSGDADEVRRVADDFYKGLVTPDGINVRRDTFVGFLKNIRNYPDHHYHLAIVLVGENDPRVRDFLVNIGWPQEAFKKK